MVIKQLGLEHDLVEMKALFQKQAARLEEMEAQARIVEWL